MVGEGRESQPLALPLLPSVKVYRRRAKELHSLAFVFSGPLKAHLYGIVV